MKDERKKPDEKPEEKASSEPKEKERAPDFVDYGDAPKMIDRDEVYVN